LEKSIILAQLFAIINILSAFTDCLKSGSGSSCLYVRNGTPFPSIRHDTCAKEGQRDIIEKKLHKIYNEGAIGYGRKEYDRHCGKELR
jgi:hypothetical protein